MDRKAPQPSTGGTTNPGLRIAPEIDQGLNQGAPIVALESALITHGFPRPANLHIALQMQDTIRKAGALPATIAILNGEPRIGLADDELEQLASDSTARKISLRDLPIATAQAINGGTTVAATMVLAHHASIQVFATGGIGGVHRGHPEDVSADLPALASIPMVVVCAGAKAILDLPKTLEYLETHGVPVIGYSTQEFPAFYSRLSGLQVDVCAETPTEVASMAQARARLDLSAALLVCVPVPQEDELPAGLAETVIARAVEEAESAGVSGKALTPFLLARTAELTHGQARHSNEALLINNARIAARIARALATNEQC